VELTHDREFFVEISGDTAAFRDATLATLAHEVTHKYLHVNAITCGAGLVQEYENEILTDVSAAFLGLGKLLLNGCAVSGTVPVTRGTTTLDMERDLRSGYLKREQLAYVYCLVCTMRRTAREDAERNLSADALTAVRDCWAQSHRTIDPRLHDEGFKGKLVKAALDDIEAAEQDYCYAMAMLEGSIDGFCSQVRAVAKSSEAELAAMRGQVGKVHHQGTYDPALLYLRTAKMLRRIEEAERNAAAHSSAAAKLVAKLRDVETVIAGRQAKVTKPSPRWKRLFGRQGR
jgi:hypothetical protein